MDCAKKLKLRLRIEDLDLPERRNRYTRSREEREDLATNTCLARVAQQTAVESRTHIVGKYETHKEERDA